MKTSEGPKYGSVPRGRRVWLWRPGTHEVTTVDSQALAGRGTVRDGFIADLRIETGGGGGATGAAGDGARDGIDGGWGIDTGARTAGWGAAGGSTRDGIDGGWRIDTGALTAGRGARDDIEGDWRVDAGAVGLFFVASRLAMTRSRRAWMRSRTSLLRETAAGGRDWAGACWTAAVGTLATVAL